MIRSYAEHGFALAGAFLLVGVIGPAIRLTVAGRGHTVQAPWRGEWVWTAACLVEALCAFLAAAAWTDPDAYLSGGNWQSLERVWVVALVTPFAALIAYAAVRRRSRPAV